MGTGGGSETLGDKAARLPHANIAAVAMNQLGHSGDR